MSEGISTFFTDNQFKAFKQSFDHYDKNKVGKLAKKDEFRRALKALGIAPTPEEFTAMCNSTPGPTIDLVDFIATIYYFLRGADTADELTRAFTVFDPDGQGLIPIERARDILAHLKHPVTPEQANELLGRLDRDGYIDYDQMIHELRPQ
jgi:Ca2+-binding EF-hand superfamily protein